MKECLICGKEYTSLMSKQLLCGDLKCKLKRRQQTNNTEKRKLQRQNYYLKNKLQWKGKHGLTRQKALIYVKDKTCEICGSSDILVVDHCHTTDTIRGALCTGCNVGIGLLGDNVEGVKKAYDYLLRFRN